jgi:hypothetical protein
VFKKSPKKFGGTETGGTFLMELSSAPILEFDPTREAMIEPSRVFQARDVPEHCVICFFREAIEKVVRENLFWLSAEACLSL